MNKREALKDLFSIQERVNRLFDEALGGVASDESGTGTWSPAVDIYETEKGFIVEAEVPEVRQDGIDIRVQDSTLTIDGERRLEKTLLEGYHRIERSYGRFSRSFLLPGSVDRDSITATLKDGVLHILLPKKGGGVQTQIKITGQD